MNIRVANKITGDENIVFRNITAGMKFNICSFFELSHFYVFIILIY